MTWEPETLYDRPYAEQRLDRYLDEPEQDVDRPRGTEAMTDEEHAEMVRRQRYGHG
jgi:hypothetical protein